MQHTRKDTREHTMSDQFRYVLVTSDPMISLQGLQRQGRVILSKRSCCPRRWSSYGKLVLLLKHQRCRFRKPARLITTLTATDADRHTR